MLSQPDSTFFFFFFFRNLIPTLYFRTTSGKIPSALKIFSHSEKAAQEPFPEAREFPSITSLHPTLRSSFFLLPGTAGSDSIMCCVAPDSKYFCVLFSYFCNTHFIPFFPLLWLLVLPKLHLLHLSSSLTLTFSVVFRVCCDHCLIFELMLSSACCYPFRGPEEVTGSRLTSDLRSMFDKFDFNSGKHYPTFGLLQNQVFVPPKWKCYCYSSNEFLWAKNNPPNATFYTLQKLKPWFNRPVQIYFNS